MSIALDVHLGHDPRWEDRYETLSYTALALGAFVGDERLERCFAELRSVLADWERIDHQRRAARTEGIAARVAVRLADAALDRMLHRLAGTTLEVTGGKTDHPLYKRLFPEPPERVIALGLDAELPLASLVMARLDEGDVPDEIAIEQDALRGCLAAGNQALSQRATAYANLGRLQARIEAWLESAEASLSTIERDLVSIAETRSLGERWTATFFPR